MVQKMEHLCIEVSIYQQNSDCASTHINQTDYHRHMKSQHGSSRIQELQVLNCSSCVSARTQLRLWLGPNAFFQVSKQDNPWRKRNLLGWANHIVPVSVSTISSEKCHTVAFVI